LLTLSKKAKVKAMVADALSRTFLFWLLADILEVAPERSPLGMVTA